MTLVPQRAFHAVRLRVGVVVGALRTYGGRAAERRAQLLRRLPCAPSRCSSCSSGDFSPFRFSRGIRVDAVTAAIAGLGIHLGAYVSETVRAGLTSVRRDQMQAALALGMSRFAGDPHHHPAAGADPHAAGARLAVRHRHQGQRHRLGHRGAGAAAADADRRRQDLPAVRDSTPRRCSSISCSAIRWRAASTRVYRRVAHLGSS